MLLNIPELKFVFAEKYEFESKNEGEKGKLISGYFLTFVNEFQEKLVMSSQNSFDDLQGQWVNAEIDLQFREFGNQKSFKLRVNNLTPIKK